MQYKEAMENCIFRFMSGSHAYGTNREDSDEDYRGVFIAPLNYAFDLFQTSFMGSTCIDTQLKMASNDIEDGNLTGAIERIRKVREPNQFDLNFSVGTVLKPGEDEELQELRKFLKLASESNPNIIEFLYVDRLITHETEVWKTIKAKRDMFLSKKARYTFSGYAFAQLKRIKNHRGYLLDPPQKKPERKDFGLPEHTAIPKENQNAILTMSSNWLAPKAREEVIKEKQFKKELSKWQSYKKWERERNPARKKMEHKYGYDIKHAAHLIRLTRMAKEILKDGIVHVYRPDKENLQEILKGQWPYEKLMEEVEEIDTELDCLYEQSTLRHKPDHKGIAKLYKEIAAEAYNITIP